MVVNYPPDNMKEDDDWLDIAIAETLVTVIKDDHLVSTPLDTLGD